MKYWINIIIAIFCLSSVKFFAQTTKIDSLQRILKKQLYNDSIKCKTLLAIAWELKYENPKEGQKYCSEGLKLATLLKRDVDIAYALKLSGILADESGDFKGSINYYLKAIDYYKKLKDTLSVAKSEYNIGILYMNLDEIEEAKKFFYESNGIFEKKNFMPGIQLVTQNIGICHFNDRNYDSALYYFFKAKEIGEATGNIDVNTIGNIGNSYYEKKDYVKAKKYLVECTELLERSGELTLNAINFKINLAGVLSSLGETQKSIEMYEACKKSYLDLGLYYTSLSSQLLASLGEEYALNSNYKLAYENYEKAYQVKDSVFSSDFASSMSEMKEKYNAEKKELSIANLNKETKLKDAEIKNQAQQKMILVIGLIAMLGFSIVLYRNIVNKRKAHAIIKEQKAIVDEKNKEIIDSITYAKRLQSAILPSASVVNKYLPDSFLVYLPKDIVAGDFYWFDETDEYLFLAVADSTGHGVPGAMVSVVCSNALHRALHEFRITDTGKILDKARELVLETFSKSGEQVKDGMDISLICIEKRTTGENIQVKWSGANNPLIYIQSGEMKAIKAHKQPIGQTEYPTAFPTHELIFKKGDSFYLFTDGYADQFGGEKGKKFKAANMTRLFQECHSLPIDEFKQKVIKSFNNWKGEHEQVDDVCIIGVRV